MKKVKIDLFGFVFEYERPRTPEHRFKALCLLAAAGIYGGVVVKIAALCGLGGVIAMIVATVLMALISMID